jgi:uncharacterized membrane protein YcaP (DUF421 family)
VAAKQPGISAVKQVRLAVLEPDGTVSVIRSDDLKPGKRPHHRIRMKRRAVGP